ncbi:MAG: IS66 family insertion sequence element accessory protein TnpB [Rhodospirillales bacterium]|nr:IS66 family insertion sequence element accessory protein TnpB [Rhodospirillales bacterium]
MMIVPAGVKVHLALGWTDMRKGMDGLAALVQEQLKRDPFLCVGCDYVAGASRRALLRSVAVPGRHITIRFRAAAGSHPLP